MSDIQEARRREESFIGNLSGAQDDYEWIVANRAWTALGWDSFAGWWDDRVRPIMRALSMRPTREIAAAGIEQVRQEEADLPPAQRRTQRELAEMFGVGRDAQAVRQRSTTGVVTPRADLGSEPLTGAEQTMLAEAEAQIAKATSQVDMAIMYALTKDIDPATIITWIYSARLSIELLDQPREVTDLMLRKIDAYIRFVRDDGLAFAAEHRGGDEHRLPLTTDEVARLASTISGGTT